MSTTFENFEVKIADDLSATQPIPPLMTLDARFTQSNQERDARVDADTLEDSDASASQSGSELDAVVDHWAYHTLTTDSNSSSECSYDSDALEQNVHLSECSYDLEALEHNVDMPDVYSWPSLEFGSF